MTGGQRLPCPRCGESFTLLTTEPPASTDISHSPPCATGFEIEPRVQGNRWLLNKPFKANRRTALILLGVMAFMAIGALAYALHTQQFRRDNDKGIVKENPKRRPPIDEDFSTDDLPTAPAKLAALTWLPPDTNIVLGVHVRELLADPSGKSLLTQPIKIGDTPVRVAAIVGWTGFNLNEIDHLVLGEKADDPLPPPFAFAAPVTLVVRTRQDYDAEKLLHDLKAERAGAASGRPVYQFARPNAPFGKLSICCVDSRTAVYAVLPNHLNDIPAAPRTDLEQLPRELRDVLRNRVDPVGPLWIAGHSDDWKKSALPGMMTLLFKDMKKEDRERLLKVSTFAAWVQVHDPMLVRAVFDCGDDQTAKDLQKYLDIPDGADPDWKASVGEGWLTVQIRTSLKKVREALER
jgi:hypothetical protein